MAKLATAIDNRKKTPRSGEPKRPINMGQSTSIVADRSGASSEVSPSHKSQAGKVKVYLNPLVVLLASAEKQKGQPLTREEVLEIREKAAFVMMSPEHARKLYDALDAQVPVSRLDPDRIWEEWQEIRGKLK